MSAAWTTHSLAPEDAGRTAMDLWYRGHKGGKPLGDLDPNGWVPVVWTYRESGTAASLTDLAQKVSDALHGPVTLPGGATPKGMHAVSRHDFIYFLYSVMTSSPREGELIIFTQNPDELVHRQASLVADLATGGTTADIQTVRIGGWISGRWIDPGAGPSDLSAYATQAAGVIQAIAAAPTGGKDRLVGAVIDHSIGFANTRFRLPGGTKTRFEAVWAQQASTRADTFQAPSTGVVSGRSYGRSDIDGAMAKLGADLEDEAELYNWLGITDRANPSHRHWDNPLDVGGGHGSHVTDIAYGADPFDPAESDFATETPLLAVQLPSELVLRTNGYLHEPFVKSGLNWIWLQAQLMAGTGRAPKIVLNYSFGDYADRHDGFGMLDADFQRRLTKGEFALISLPTGNSYLTSTHAVFEGKELKKANGDRSITLRVQPDDKVPTFTEFWVRTSTAGSKTAVSVKATTPSGVVSGGRLVSLGDYEELVINGDVIARIYYQKDAPKYLVPGGPAPALSKITLAIMPTRQERAGLGEADHGAWELQFKGGAALADTDQLEIWVERGDTPSGIPTRGRQAYLEHPNFQWRDDEGRPIMVDDPKCPIKRFGTISSILNAEAPLGVAGYRFLDQRMSDFSSASSPDVPAAGGAPLQPTLAAVAEYSASRPGVLAAGTYSGTVRGARGTSSAAPLMVREAVKIFHAAQAKAPGSAVNFKAELTAQVLPNPPDVYRAGAGLHPANYDPTPGR